MLYIKREKTQTLQPREPCLHPPCSHPALGPVATLAPCDAWSPWINEFKPWQSDFDTEYKSLQQLQDEYGFCLEVRFLERPRRGRSQHCAFYYLLSLISGVFPYGRLCNVSMGSEVFWVAGRLISMKKILNNPDDFIAMLVSYIIYLSVRSRFKTRVI